jgi:diadenosine tetraphosphate (Ap4A) HIT family hydrolase
VPCGDNAVVDSPQPARRPADTAEYARRVRESRDAGRCFICRIASGTSGSSHQVVYEDAGTIVFLNRYPTLLGYCLAAPRRHVEDWVHDLAEAEFLALQHVVHRVARAIAAVVPTERMYCLSLGSQQGNAHVHWHIAALPPGVPYHQQQYYALMTENGVLDVDDSAQAALARAIKSHL